MRVLATLDAVGGVWRFALDLAAGLHAEGIETAFLGFGPEPSSAQRAQAERLGPVEWSPAPLDWLTADEAALAEVPCIVAAAAERAGADLIHLNLPSQGAGIETGLPVVAMSHSCVATWFRAVRGASLPPGWAWQGRLNAEGLARADVAVAPSESHAAALRACYGPLPRLVVVPNATAAPETGEDGGGAPVIVASGRWWDEGKGGAVLDAAAKGARWPVRLLGSLHGPSGASFEPRHAEVLGERPHAEAVTLMREAAIFASPSLYEPFGLAVAEAARAGRPLVLSDVPAFRELWEGAAVLVPPRDPVALREALDRLAGDPGERRRLGASARERARALAPERQAARMAALYRRLARPLAPPLSATA